MPGRPPGRAGALAVSGAASTHMIEQGADAGQIDHDHLPDPDRQQCADAGERTDPDEAVRQSEPGRRAPQRRGIQSENRYEREVVARVAGNSNRMCTRQSPGAASHIPAAPAITTDT